MPEYTVQNPQTKQTVTFRWNHDQPPTDADLDGIFAEAAQHQAAPPAPPPSADSMLRNVVGNAAQTLLPSTTPRDYIEGPLYAMQHPIESAKLVGGAILDAHKATGTKAVDLARQAVNDRDPGAAVQSAGYAAATALPMLGPAAAHAGEQIESGDFSGGLGTAIGLLAPSAMSAAKAKTGPLTASVRERLATQADRMSANSLTDVMVPKVGPNKIRFGNAAAVVAPDIARDPSLGAWSREGLQTHVDTKLAEAETALDAAANARNGKKVYPTKPIVAELNAKIGRRTAQTASAGGVKAGADVVPAPNQARVSQITQAIQEIQQLGPYASYEALRRIRESYDGPAKAIYSPSMTADYMARMGDKLGASDVSGVLRDKLGVFDPNTAKANADYALYKSASDVLAATEETQRTRPTTGRKMLTAAVGGSLGEAIHPGVGMAIGVALGPLVDEALNAGLTTKIATARQLANLADALRSNQPKRANSILSQLQSASVRQGRVNTGNQAPQVPKAAQDRREEQSPQAQDAR